MSNTSYCELVPTREAQALAVANAIELTKLIEKAGGRPARLYRMFAIGPKTFAGRRGTPKQCYKNAVRLLWKRPDLTYCEGYVVILGGLPLEHAWCVDEQGDVVDPTLKPDDVEAYYGIPFELDYVERCMLRTRTYGVLGANRDSNEEFERGVRRWLETS